MLNRYILVPLLVWAITQFLKFVVAAANGRVDFKYLYASGGMPSVHSAVVTALAFTSFIVDGASSSTFGITIVLAAIVMYDSFGVRRSAGEQAVALNQIMDTMRRDRLGGPDVRMRELLGHKPLEVSVGAVIGFVLAGLLNYDKLSALWSFLASNTEITLTYGLAALGLILVIAAVGGRYWYARRYRDVSIVMSAAKTSFWSGLAVGLVGILLAFLQYEKVTIATWVLWLIIYVLIVIATGSGLWWYYRPRVPAALADYTAKSAKAKWFEGPNPKNPKSRKKRR